MHIQVKWLVLGRMTGPFTLYVFVYSILCPSVDFNITFVRLSRISIYNSVSVVYCTIVTCVHSVEAQMQLKPANVISLPSLSTQPPVLYCFPTRTSNISQHSQYRCHLERAGSLLCVERLQSWDHPQKSSTRYQSRHSRLSYHYRCRASAIRGSWKVTVLYY